MIHLRASAMAKTRTLHPMAMPQYAPGTLRVKRKHEDGGSMQVYVHVYTRMYTYVRKR